MIVIREAQKSDLNEIVRLSIQAREYHNQILGNYFNVLDTDFEHRFLSKAIDDENQKLLVAVLKDEIVGMVLVAYQEKKWLAKEHTYQIDNICVDQTHRRQGIGTKLLDAVMTLAKQNGIQQINLGVFCQNKQAIPFYESFGFKPLSIKMNMPVK